MAAALTTEQSSKVMHFNGYRYATLDFTAPGYASSSYQSNFCTFPAGWQVAPDVPEIVEQVIGKYPWGTMLLLLDSGAGYGTSLSDSPGKLMKKTNISRDGDKAKPCEPSSPAQRILITDSWISSVDHSWSIAKHLFTSQCFTDCTLECGSEVMKCHRAVLSLSPVFHRMFESDMREGLENHIKISDAEPHIMKAFIQFMYLGSAPIKSGEELAQLLVLADKYELDDLAILSATRLIDQMDRDTAIDVIKNLRPFVERHSFQPVVQKLREALIASQGALDMIIKNGC
mmetsp:Transcript_20212/g.36013  ORF Transcript_20212/g.36013 Transcript_20212/m.36013 type:complete len:287 (-) Transcript_20212:129-989(-)|eukprot:CAMPEP_0197626304 /NCGR_PEP_ID=MMETSP1338-20131121/5338_1 /TAXON_ID=43686 ORGANISM="Pelagodinium beii, Strain RCC1491" /NCGR_SAMPLE_ID=MMETSP1338 /ASSEMBLY_ACC=CAM_ASM_000754 /LENGTH=286 /DNA_ID=CAMNT_0043196837 /DNA_START=52 /DNA_END=912 /DNA_ORIENTATION=+